MDQATGGPSDPGQLVRTPGQEARIRRPRPRRGDVVRLGLLGRLATAEGVVAITAPPGFGKTTLAQQWAEALDRPVAWLTVDDADDDPVVLARDLAASLAAALVDAGAPAPDLSALGVPHIDQAGATAVLAAALVGGTAPALLVVDDVHRLSSPGATALLGAIIDQAPADACVALVGRHLPDGLHGPRRVLAAGGLIVGADDLRLADHEARAIVRSRRTDLGDEAVGAIIDRADGWAALVGLSVLGVPANARPSDVAVSLTPTGGQLVGDYLRAELLGDLGSEATDLLVRTSVLERVTGDLCDALLDRSGSAAVLESLARAGDLFVTAFDGENTWYSYHQVLRDLLLATLRSTAPGDEVKLRLRAARWLDRHGDPDAAVAQAAAAGEPGEVADVVYRNLLPVLADGRGRSLERWLAAVDPRDVAANPALALAAGWAAVLHGSRQEVLRWLAVAERFPDEAPLPDGLSVAGGVAALRVGTAPDGMRRAVEASDLLASFGATPWWAVSRSTGAIGRFLLGEQADPAAALAAAADDASPVPAAKAPAMSYLVVVLVEAGRRREAETVGRELRSLLVDHGLDHYPLATVAHGALGLLAAVDGDRDELERRDERGLGLLATAPGSVTRTVTTRLLLGRAWVLVGELERAAAHLEATRALLADEPDGVTFARWWTELDGQLQMARDAASTTAFTAAERRVLAELPSHRSLEEIGQRLYVSRNTVKSHTIAIYRKLGVSSRSEAVDAATRLGLLPATADHRAG